MSDGQKEVRIGLRLAAAIDDAGRRDEMLNRKRIDGIVRHVAAGNPVNRRIEMRPGMLAEAHIVPVPGRPAFVVARDFLHAERTRLTHLRRQYDRRKVRRQRLRQIDDSHAARRSDAAQDCAQIARGVCWAGLAFAGFCFAALFLRLQFSSWRLSLATLA